MADVLDFFADLFTITSNTPEDEPSCPSTIKTVDADTDSGGGCVVA